MPTNVSPEYKKAEEAYRQAKTIDEKIERLEDMISALPKHKGTDHLYADLKRRLSKLRKEAESSGKKGGESKGEPHITREGAAQVVLLGPPNSGKSSILAALSNAKTEVAEYPFTTIHPLPGMVPFKDIQLQLVDTPPVTDDYIHAHLLGLVRSADAVLLVADLSKDSLWEELETVIQVFADRHVQFVANTANSDRDHIPAKIIANKCDAPEADIRLELLREALEEQLEVVPLSSRAEYDHQQQHSVQRLPSLLVDWLGIIRIYTKAPGEKADYEKPFTLFRDQTVEDLCAQIHRDFLENFKSARLWRDDNPPMTVSRHEPLEDGDILELHM
jgi:ribosome-interacting GTPase 1